MADSVHLELHVGADRIVGESTITSHGRERTIECVAYGETISVTDGRAGVDEVWFDKRIDRSSPRLAQALFQREELSATFRFYRSSMTSP
ncbi:MAG: type VI secretion system tube protein Hcp [Deltaproteobacteria bacterium]|nr:type VI secretion system tube protein Hcp [Deltaproteobacteria bacterium]